MDLILGAFVDKTSLVVCGGATLVAILGICYVVYLLISLSESVFPDDKPLDK